jgi:hypothetical protein
MPPKHLIVDPHAFRNGSSRPVCAARRRLYRSAYDADLTRLRATHGETALAEALRHLGSAPASTWDEGGHRHEVARAVNRLLNRKAADPDSFSDDGVKV